MKQTSALDTTLLFQHAFENIIYKMSAILSPPQVPGHAVTTFCRITTNYRDLVTTNFSTNDGGNVTWTGLFFINE